MHITPDQAQEIIRVTLLTRAGAVITPELAEERARNCAAALCDTTIGRPGGDLLAACESALKESRRLNRRGDGLSANTEIILRAAIADCRGESNREDDEDDEPRICSACDGSGEGQYDGTRCRWCSGDGIDDA